MANEQDKIDGLSTAVSNALTKLRAICASIDVTSEEDANLLQDISQCHDALKIEARKALGMENTAP